MRKETLIARLEEIWPWLMTEEDEQISGADTIDELQQLYDNLKASEPDPIDDLDERQTATVLHALRAFQLYGPSKVLCDSHEACPHFDGIEPLTAEEIDALCERLNYGVEQPKDEQQTQRCVYCGGDVPQDVAAEVPTVSDQEAWERISKYHTSGCEWVNTRAHRGDYEQPEEESQPEAHVCFSDARTWADGKRHCQKCDKPMERSQW